MKGAKNANMKICEESRDQWSKSGRRQVSTECTTWEDISRLE